jgi:toxin YoeB
MLNGASLLKWKVVFTKQTQKDTKKLASAGLKPKADELIRIRQVNPFLIPPLYEKLVCDLTGACSRRVNITPTYLSIA